MSTENTYKTQAIRPNDLKTGTYSNNPYSELFQTKIFISGKRIEVQRYRNPIVRIHNKTSKKSKTVKEKLDKPKTARRKDNITRARKKMTRTIHSNMPIKNKKRTAPRWVTLTYSDALNNPHADPKNSDLYMTDFKHFIRRLSKTFNQKIEYTAVTELTKNKRIHFHLVIYALPRNEFKDIEEAWGQGTIDIKSIKPSHKGSTKIVKYCAKYMGKEFGDDRQYQNLYFSSVGLHQAREVTDSEEVAHRLQQAYELGYFKTFNNQEYDMPFHYNSVTYEIWEPLVY